jgi:hypothetical protein
MIEFPTMVYRVPGAHIGPNGTTYDFLGVNNQEEFDAAIAAGWSESVGLAAGIIREVREAKAAIKEITPPIRAEMEKKARKIGVPFNARTSDKVLAERIAAA